MTCKLCEERGKTWKGDNPKCAFKNGVFISDNFNCATMNKLRVIAEEINTVQRDDNSCGSIGYVPMSVEYVPEDFNTYGGYIVMMWYKDRGATGNAVFMTDTNTVPLTIKHAEVAIVTHKKEYGFYS